MARLLVDSKRLFRYSNLLILVEGATSRGYTELLKIGLNNDLLPPDKLRHALVLAAEGGHLAIVELLSQKAGKYVHMAYGCTALQVAAGSGHLAMVERLLQFGAPINGFRPLQMTALLATAAEGHLSVVEMLLQKGASVNMKSTIDRRTALHAAAEQGHLAIVERLLREDVDIDDTDGNGRTALSFAVELGYLPVVERLLQMGADATKIHDKTTGTLNYAIEGNRPVVERSHQISRRATNMNNIDGLKLSTAIREKTPDI